MKKLLLLFIILPLFAQSGFGQKAPVTFGKVDPQDVKMKVYDLDTSAVAVVLADYGYFDVEDFDFTRTLRVKILKKAGYGLADFKYHVMNKPIIRGVVYNLVGDEIVKEKLPSTSVFTKRFSNDTYEVSVAIPNVKEGTVFDLEVTFTGLPYEWAFQSGVPIRLSELRIPTSSYIDFSKNFFGYLPLSVNTNERWVSVNAPAFKSEPYINSPENYQTKFEIDIRAITLPGYFKTYTFSWENVNSVLAGDTDFPRSSQLFICLSSAIDELKASGKKGDELMKAAFEAAKKVNFNGDNRVYVSEEGLCSHYKLGTGSSADVNFVLLQLLTKLDFNAYPVVLSTRANGMLSQFNPSLNKLNYVMVAVKKDEGFVLLDATEKYMPYNILPDRVINGNGRIVSDQYSQWIALTCQAKETSDYQYEMTLNEDLTLTGKIKMILSGYAAYDFRDNFDSYNNKEEFARALEKNQAGLIVNDITIDDIDDIYKPVTVTIEGTIEGMVTQIDNEIYINPLLFEQVKDNPFKAEERVYPISYSRLEETKVNVKINLPENITIGILPKPITTKVKGNSYAFSYAVTSTEKMVEANYTFNINSLTIPQPQYKEVRALYNNLVNKHAEPIILKLK